MLNHDLMDERARVDLDRKDADPNDPFSYEEEQRKNESRIARRKTASNETEPRKEWLNCKQLKANLLNGQGNFRSIIIRNDEIDFDLSGSAFDGSVFVDIIFDSGTLFLDTSFNDCIFINCKFKTIVSMDEMDFSSCTLINCDVNWDGHSVKDTKIIQDKPGSWEKLKSSYIGNGARFHILLSMFYFVPLVLHVFLNYVTAQLQNSAYPFSKHLPYLKLFFEGKKPTGSLFTGIFESETTVGIFLLFIVLVYQIQRLILTYNIGKLSDVQDVEKTMPSMLSFTVFRYMHRVNMVLVLFVLVAACLNIMNFFSVKLWVPVDIGGR